MKLSSAFLQSSLLLGLLACQGTPPLSTEPIPSPGSKPSTGPTAAPTGTPSTAPLARLSAPLTPRAASKVEPLSLAPVSLKSGQERQLRLDLLQWSPDRSRFSYLLNDDILGPDAKLSSSLRLREQNSQKDQELKLPAGKVSNIWWLDNQQLAVLLQTASSPTATDYTLYRLQVQSGETTELKRLQISGRKPEIYSLHAEGPQLMYVDLAGDQLRLNLLNGLNGQLQSYNTGLPASRLNAYASHQLAAPDSDSLILLAGYQQSDSPASLQMQTQSLVPQTYFEAYRLQRSSGKVSKIKLSGLEDGSFELSPQGRYLLQGHTVSDLLKDTSQQISSIDKPFWWSEGVLFAFESAAVPPMAGVWFDAASSQELGRISINYDQTPVPDAHHVPLKFSAVDGGFLLHSGNGTWFCALMPNPSAADPLAKELGISQAAIKKMGPSEAIPLLTSQQHPSQLRQQSENSPLTASKQGSLNMKVYQPDGQQGGLFLLLDIQAPKS